MAATEWPTAELTLELVAFHSSRGALRTDRHVDWSMFAAYGAAHMWEPEQVDSRLRVSDADRDQISDVLGEHAAEGRLTMDELDRRLGLLFAAQTRAEVAPLLADLPVLAAPGEEHHHLLGHEREEKLPTLPEWLKPAELVALVPPPSPTTAVSAPRQDKAAMRKRAKLRQDENAIGHAFQATRRSIAAALERARAAGSSIETEQLEQRLRDANAAAEPGRQAVTAGNRAAAQQQLARLRSLALPNRA